MIVPLPPGLRINLANPFLFIRLATMLGFNLLHCTCPLHFLRRCPHEPLISPRRLEISSLAFHHPPFLVSPAAASLLPIPAPRTTCSWTSRHFFLQNRRQSSGPNGEQCFHPSPWLRLCHCLPQRETRPSPQCSSRPWPRSPALQCPRPPRPTRLWFHWYLQIGIPRLLPFNCSISRHVY
jgi:hypothetical protein